LKKRLVLFDFDGTITTKDTLFEFIKYYVGKPRFILGLAYCLPVLVLYKARIIVNWRAKEFVLRYFLGNENIEDINSKGKSFCHEVIPKIIKPNAIKRLKEHYEQGHEIYVVSASASNWIRFWCKKYQIGCIATELEVKNNRITGKIKGKNCHGPEKVNRIKAELNIDNYSSIFAYGDSRGDFEMLKLANNKYYREF